ncbi:hypothetical protein [Agreia sp.]|uniref:hypothetical protein n=1 Tax=Agreia sp. TaxID=1872416 RepID=UPI0035BBCCEF
MDAIEVHRPVNRLRLLLLGGLVGAGFIVGGIFLSATPAHADGGLLDGLGGVVSEVTQPVNQLVDTVGETAVPVVDNVTAVVPEPVAEVVQPVVQPVVEQVVLPVVEALPQAPVAEIVQPVTDLVDPIASAVPVVGDVLGSTPTASVIAPVVELADGTLGTVADTVVTVAPALPGASGPTAPGVVVPSIPGLDLPDSSTVGSGTNGFAVPSSAPVVIAVSLPTDGTRTAPVRGPSASGLSAGLPAPGQAGSVSSSAPSTPGSPVPAGPSEGSVVVLPTPSGSGGHGASGGAGSGGLTAVEAIPGSLFAHAALTVRALGSDDALPASPTFDLGSTPD